MRRLSQAFSNMEADSSGSDNDTDTESNSSCSKSVVPIQSQDSDHQTPESPHGIDADVEEASVVFQPEALLPVEEDIDHQH